MQVLQWMEDSGTKPSAAMFRNILSFAHKSVGTEYAVVIQKRIGTPVLQKKNSFSDFMFPFSAALNVIVIEIFSFLSTGDHDLRFLWNPF